MQLEGLRMTEELIAAGPGRHVKWLENLTIGVIGSKRYAEYLMPVYREAAEILHARIPELNLDFLKAVVRDVMLGRLRRRVKRGRGRGLLRRLFLSFDDVDWARTQAFSIGNFGQIYINVKGRRPQGIVAPGAEYDALRERIIKAALELRDPDGGDRVIAMVSGMGGTPRLELYLVYRELELILRPEEDFLRVVDPATGKTTYFRNSPAATCWPSWSSRRLRPRTMDGCS